ncbi:MULTISPECIES: exo-beta-N-acetylmuramidase NamZ family protein [Gracilibacillus]|uniref:exo-beta-N-acetylmuramidase NamZ family protein n=1 Tax=Gracilibacillus TaxID=74385 RepID=UPI0008260553|nr:MULTISPECIES: DUF1343 domain-containing protein [Gracilibacillus]
MKIGLDFFIEEQFKEFKGQRIGLLTNITGVNQQLIPAIDLLYKHPSINLTTLYSPEHGIRGEAKEGEQVSSSTDPYTGLPVYSLYGEKKEPTKEMMDPVDVVVFDLQDIGSRYYTFIYTMAYMMKACEKFNKHFVVLDRPNPISGKIEGNIVETDVRSFVGLLPIPNRHGMTVGELAQLFKCEFGYNCLLTVVPMQGWDREKYFDELNLIWVSPSPNTTNIDMCTLYAGTCLIEGTNLSEGRGTTRPFEIVGAPFINGQLLAKKFNEKKNPGILARPTTFAPFYQKYENEKCEGIHLHIKDRKVLNSVQVGLSLIETVAEIYPNHFYFKRNDQGKYFFDLLAGTKQLRALILKGETEVFLRSCNGILQKFQKLKEPYLLYK